jgi:uncharacterized protein YndB with AHSA1/START domain
MSKSINHTLFYPQKPELVWEYLTTPALMAQWLMPTDFEPILGHEFTFRTGPLPKFDFDGIVYCRVLEILPPKKLVYSWKGGPGNGQVTMDSVVTWTLIEKDKGTELTLEHSGFKVLTNVDIFNGMNAGWLQNMKKILDRLNAAAHGHANV